MAKILPTEENFILLFHRDNPLDSSVEFMRSFLLHLLKEAKPETNIEEGKLIEYTSSILQLFDQNKDGKLQLSEMARLLPVKENYLCRPIFKDANGTIEDEELSGFLKDLLELAQEDYDEADLEFFKKVILNQWDVNNDGKINRDELKMMLMQQSRLLGDRL
ncbi:uncharacterized protein DC041_0011578 [Schistosoma bovis]|uniref:EF-hand domain-containing protein n=1 Tax=Schistosoma bovis TaxID=6184 RepID=A0A430QMX4_SCHBO|nr:uncharacterized protein DC041_0011578 [Schistosoma bovis]